MSDEATTDLVSEMKALARRGREASLVTATWTTEQKNQLLETLAGLIESSEVALLEANEQDLAAGREAGLAQPLLERLTFTPERIKQMAEGVRQVAGLPDPVGQVLETTTRPNGLDIRKVRVPIGVVGIIYESRPNVTIDCAVLCLKSGNAAILRGGKEAFHSNMFLAGLIREALEKQELDAHAVQLVPTTEREALNTLLTLSDDIHCIIPRGGEGLIDFVTKNSHIPVIKHYKGVCSVYVDKAADLDMAEAIVINAKTQRVSVCNAIENLYIHKANAREVLGRLAPALRAQGVELRCHPSAARILDQINHAAILLADDEIEYEFAQDAEFYEEYLDYKLSIMVVDSLEDAIRTVNRYGSGHSESIVTADEASATQFLNSVDAATVYWNASTRFTDGFEFGLGAEIGISTDRLHARGPMGLRELCTYKFQIFGTGQIK